jgi:hypothetical protein
VSKQERFSSLKAAYSTDMCMPYRDVPTMDGQTLAQRYEATMSRLEQITRAGYEVEI